MCHFGIMRKGSSDIQARPTLLMVVVCLVFGLSSCGGGGRSNGSLSISFAAQPLSPPAVAGLAATVNFAALVNGDPGSQGVNWTVACTPGTHVGANCGAITAHTASGYPATYTGPPDKGLGSIPAGGAVTVTAAATADPSKSITATIGITAGPISIAFNTPPPLSMLTGATASVVAYVTNDIKNSSANAGADFTVTCSSLDACGSIVPSHTDGTATSFTLFTAPQVVPIPDPFTGATTVTITATSTADPTQSTAATVLITRAPVSIALAQAPAVNVRAGASTNLTAVVSLDPDNAGVDWSALCQSDLCGSFTPIHTASGQLTTYTAPSTLPGGDNTVTITAASTTSPKATATAVITVTPANVRNDLLNGSYAFLLQGVREGGPWAIAGSFVADGVGNISVGTERFPVDDNVTSHPVSGSYFMNSDGTGTITLNGVPTGLGYWRNGQQVFKVTEVTASHLLMEEFDGYYDPILHVAYGGTLSGTLDRQVSVASGPLSPGSSYSFLLSGFTPSNQPTFYGGTIVGGLNNFTMDRSVAGVVDSISGTALVSGTISGTIQMDPYTFGYYVIDSGHSILIATSRSSDFAAGHLYSQPTVISAPTGNFAFTMSGATPLPQGSSPLAMGGTYSCDAQGTTAGPLDANLNGSVSSTQVSGSMSVTSSGPSRGRGTLTLTDGPAQHFIVYPTARHGILMLQLDPQSSGVGAALPQTTGVTASMFSGLYAGKFQTMGGINAANGGVGPWNDFLGLLTADGVSGLSGPVALEQFDESSRAFWTQTPDAQLSGTFSPGTQGRFNGPLSVPPLGTSQRVFYILDSSTVLSLGLDSTPSTGILEQQKF